MRITWISNRKRIQSVALGSVVFALAASAGVATPSRAGEVELTCEQVPGLVRQFLQKHITFHYLNEELRNRAIDSYIEHVDPSKTLFLQEEVLALKKDLLSIFLDVSGGNCTRLTDLQTDIVKRYKEMEGFVRKLVGDEQYAVDPDVQLIIDPKKRGYPLDAEQQRELYTKLVHFQVSNYLSTDVEMEEAKRRLIHRYELSTRRAVEFEPVDIFALFLDSFATSLDPHSNYLSAEAVEDFQIGMELSLDGIGVALSSRDGYSIVEKIIPGGAAASLKALEPKDKIIAVAQEDGEFVDIIDMDLRDVVRLIRGKRGTKVHLTVLREAETVKRFPVTIVRDKINLEEQAANLEVETITVDDVTYKVGILELPSFYGGRNPLERQSSRDVRKLLEEANEAGVDGLLLDLSRNGGGLLDHSVEIGGFFIDEGGVVAYKDTFSKTQVLRDPNPGLVFDGPLVVLTSRVSASASEIVAGALKDYGRAIIVGGDHTFGKGTVQSMVQLPVGLGSIKVTTALFFRPGGDSTQHSGVSADIPMPSRFSSDDFGESHQPYSLPPQRIHAFLEEDTSRAEEPKLPWRPVTPDLVQKLRERSAERVTTSEEFREIEENLEKTRERAGVLQLDEIIKEREEEAAKEEAEREAAEKKEAEQRANGAPAEEVKEEEAKEEEAKEGGEEPKKVAEEEDVPPTPQRLEAIQILGDFIHLLKS